MEDTQIRDIKDNWKLQPLNIMVVGLTGVGKSTLLEAMFGKNIQINKISNRKTHLTEYPSTDIERPHVQIWETEGFELSVDKKTESETLNKIKSIIEERNASDNPEDKIHMIWYCRNACSRRFASNEAEFIDELFKLKTEHCFILTQCFDDEFDKEFEEAICEYLKRDYGIDLSCIKVLAKEMHFRHPLTKEIIVIPSKGIDELVRLTVEQLPENLKPMFMSAVNFQSANQASGS